MPPPTQLHLPLPAPQPGAEGGDSLPDRLCALIVRRGRPLEVGHVASQLLRLRRCPERLQRRLVAELVEGDARLAWLGRDLVGLAPPEWSSAGLASATFCVVDLETTGGSPGLSKVTEIGAVRVHAGEVVDRFVTLVNPNRPIPPIVTELTGIDDDMVAGSPDIEDALAAFVEFAGSDVLVAHNAPFDLRFLNYERRRLASRYFTQPWLDTLVLARRLLDGQVERHDLRTLAGWADTSVQPIHRALPDAEATAEVLLALLRLLADRGVDTLERAVAFGGTNAARHAHKLALAEELPPLPGVYVMRDRRGRALYVGKAGDLRRRVRSYFGPGGRHGRLIGRALEQLDSIDHEVCGSEFAALLRENDLIKELAPSCNRRGAGAPGRYLKVSLGELAPRLYVVPGTVGDGAAYFGPMRSERLARRAVAELHALYPLSAQDPAVVRAGLAEVELLLGGDAAAIGRLGGRIAGALADGRLEFGDDGDDAPAAAALGVLGALARVRRAVRRAAVVVEPAREEGAAEIWFVAGGIVRIRAAVSAHDWRDAARAGLDAVRRAGRRPAFLAGDALDEVAIVEARLVEGASTGSALRLGPGWRTAEALAWVEGAVARVCASAPAAAG